MNARIYSLLLALYPADLRMRFGAEMTEVFLEDLEDSRLRNGVAGVARVWWRSVQELCRIALPAEAGRREIAVPLIMYVLQVCDLSGVVFLGSHDPRNTLPAPGGGEFVGILIASLIPALIGWVVLRVGDRSVPVPLSLRHP